MKQQNIVIILDNGEVITKTTEYQIDYELKRDIISLGTNGVMKEDQNSSQNSSQNSNIIEYFPPHRIVKIIIEKIDSGSGNHV